MPQPRVPSLGPAPWDDDLTTLDPDTLADRLGQLHLCEGTKPLPRMLPQDPAPWGHDLIAIDSNTLVWRIKAHLGLNPELEWSRRAFYRLASTFCQVSRGRPIPQETEFWDPSVSLPYSLRNAVELFEWELA